MNEYDRHLEIFATHWHQSFTKLMSRSEWGDKAAAETYLQKYWLSLAEYEFKWRKIQDQIFVTQKWLPELLFSPQYDLLAFRGGCLFIEEDFKKLQECFLSVGDQHFFVIENLFGGTFEADEPSFRMKYPTSISWDELTSGNFISAMILEFSNKEFFVFGETAAWGRYSASSYENPVDIVGFLPKYASFFQEKLKVPEKEKLEIATEWVPSAYRPFLK